jgi:hypothetical protein
MVQEPGADLGSSFCGFPNPQKTATSGLADYRFASTPSQSPSLAAGLEPARRSPLDVGCVGAANVETDQSCWPEDIYIIRFNGFCLRRFPQ